MKMILAAASVQLALMNPACAGPAADATRAHLNAIGAGNLAQAVEPYGEHPRLSWIGGPLDGEYEGAGGIGETWTKFMKAQGPMRVALDELSETANAKGATVVAMAVFEGKVAVRVRYVASYRAGKLAHEIWQVAAP